jgi:hypothetical protein
MRGGWWLLRRIGGQFQAYSQYKNSQTPSSKDVLTMAKNDRTVSRRPNGTWANKKDGSDRAASLHPTQKSAADIARRMLRESGGGELKIKGEDGRIRSKDTIPPGNDPFPPRDREH